MTIWSQHWSRRDAIWRDQVMAVHRRIPDSRVGSCLAFLGAGLSPLANFYANRFDGRFWFAWFYHLFCWPLQRFLFFSEVFRVRGRTSRHWLRHFRSAGLGIKHLPHTKRKSRFIILI